MERFETAPLREKASHIKLVVFDVDGIMTNGDLHFLPDGREIKTFNTLDGLGLKLLHLAGIETAIITGRRSPQVDIRAEALNIGYLRQGREDKLTALQEIWDSSDFTAECTAYMGDDLPDLAAMLSVNLAATVPNGHPLVQSHAHWCSSRPGGAGAVREFCEALLDAQGRLVSIYQDFQPPC